MFACSEQGILGRQVERWKEGAATSHPEVTVFKRGRFGRPPLGLQSAEATDPAPGVRA